MKKIIYILAIFIYSLNLNAQETEVQFTPDSTKFKIGEQINVLLQVKTSVNDSISWPLLTDTIGEFEVIARSKIDTLINNDYQIVSQSYKLTQFDSGSYVLTPIRFQIGDSIYYTKPKMIDINTVVVDTTKQKMFSIKGNIHVGYTFWEILPFILTFIIVLAFIYMAYYLWMKRKPKEHKKLIPKIPPYDLAMINLKRLDEANLIKDGKIKSYYVELTDILRTFIEKEHGILALESTTDEIMLDLSNVDISKETKLSIKELLTQSDFVKFAKHIPSEGKHPYFRKTTEDIINNSRLIIVNNDIKIETDKTNINE